MKWPKSHFERVSNIILNKGLSVEEFSFVKRKGWVHMIHNASNYDFSYIHRKETRINEETLDWEESSYFEIKKSPGGQDIASDQTVLFDKFHDWVKALDI